MKLGIAADHGGYNLKEEVKVWLNSAGHQVKDFGAHQLDQFDDYPDYVVPLSASGSIGRSEIWNCDMRQRRRCVDWCKQNCRRESRFNSRQFLRAPRGGG